MNRIFRLAAFSAVSIALAGVPAIAQDDHPRDQTYNQDHRNDADHHDAYVHHDEWKRGYEMKHEDWARASRVDDWHDHHLRRPPRGYEWRQIDGNYVLGAVDTGRINAVVTVR